MSQYLMPDSRPNMINTLHGADFVDIHCIAHIFHDFMNMSSFGQQAIMQLFENHQKSAEELQKALGP